MRTRILCTAMLAVVLFLFCENVLATRVASREYQCPVCDNRFESMVLTSYYGGMIKRRLDFNRSLPLLIPQCTKCKYVFLGSHKTVDGRVITSSETAEIKAFVLSGRYTELPDSMPEYHRLALIMEQLNVSADSLADTYLTASWQYEYLHDPQTGEWVPDREQKVAFCLKKCLSLLEDNPFLPTAPLRDRLPAAYLLVELNRRLGNFEEAEKRLVEVIIQLERAESLIEHFSERNANMVRMIRKCASQQADLIGKQISAPAEMDED